MRNACWVAVVLVCLGCGGGGTTGTGGGGGATGGGGGGSATGGGGGAATGGGGGAATGGGGGAATGGGGGAATGGGGGAAAGGGGGSATGGGGGTMPPSAPASLTATPSSPTSVSLSWEASAGAVNGYEVEVASAAVGPFAALGTSLATTYAHSGATTGTTYYYRVRATSAAGPSAYSPVASATPYDAVGAPPEPTGLSVTVNSSTALTVQWSVSTPTTVEVERAMSGTGPWGLVNTAAAGTQLFADGNLDPATTYYYRVRSRNASGPSTYAGPASATTQLPNSPAAPTDLSITHEPYDGGTAMHLRWTDVATNETSYEVEHAVDGGAWSPSATLPANTNNHYSTDIASLRMNDYRVRAVNAGGPSAWISASMYAGPVLLGYLCAAPGSPTAAATSETTIHVSWTYASLCDRVVIERAPAASGPFVEIATQANLFGFTPDYDDRNVTPGSTWYYRFRSIPNNGSTPTGPASSVVSATTPSTLLPPTNLQATVTSASTATLTWTESAMNETGFGVEFSTTSASGPFTQAFQVGPNVTTAGVQGLTPDTQYYVRVVTLRNALRAPGTAVGLRTAKTVTLRTTADTTIVESTAMSSYQNSTLASGPNSVGCYFIATNDLGGNLYGFHNCGGSLLRFDASAVAGKMVLAAVLVLTPCALAPDSVASAAYDVRAVAGAWNPATVTFNTAPQLYVQGGWQLPAPTTSAPSVFDVTPIVRNWASGAWVNNGLYVRQYPVVDRIPPVNAMGIRAQDQTTNYCSLEVTGGNSNNVPTVLVDYF